MRSREGVDCSIDGRRSGYLSGGQWRRRRSGCSRAPTTGLSGSLASRASSAPARYCAIATLAYNRGANHALRRSPPLLVPAVPSAEGSAARGGTMAEQNLIDGLIATCRELNAKLRPLPEGR